MTRVAKFCGGIQGPVTVCLIMGVVLGAQRARPSPSYVFHRLASKIWRPAVARMDLLPKVTFWAWERPEDLRFLDPQKASVAFLASTIYLAQAKTVSASSDAISIVVRPRLQPLRVNPKTPLIAVIRIETLVGKPSVARIKSGQTPSSAPLFTAEQLSQTAEEIAKLQTLPGVRAVQVDFDATVSERAFYAALLTDVRRKLPPSLPLSITALSSWCIGDPWLAKLPPGTIDEAVPMLFRMGPDAGNVAKYLRTGGEFSFAACRSSLGVSTDEPLSIQLLDGAFAGFPRDWREKRIYVFSPRAWTQAAADSVLKEWEQ